MPNLPPLTNADLGALLDMIAQLPTPPFHGHSPIDKGDDDGRHRTAAAQARSLSGPSPAGPVTATELAQQRAIEQAAAATIAYHYAFGYAQAFLPSPRVASYGGPGFMYDPDGGPSFMYDPDLDRLVPVPKMEDAGFVAGEIRAWRVWMVAGRFLESLFNPTIWPAGKPLRAERFTDYENGIHAWRSRDEALAYGEFIGAPTEVRILGQVDLWGTVIEHERGYRAEYAQVVSLDEVIAPEPWLHEEIERIEREIDSTSWTGLARALLGRRVATTLERERRQQEKRDREEWILAQLRERYCPGV